MAKSQSQKKKNARRGITNQLILSFGMKVPGNRLILKKILITLLWLQHLGCFVENVAMQVHHQIRPFLQTED